MVYRVLPHKVFLPERDVVSFMDGEDRSFNPSLTFIGLFDIYVAAVSWQTCTDMVERQPNRPSPVPES
jgi:hypothetical protein